MPGFLSVTRLIAASQYAGVRLGVSNVRKVISLSPPLPPPVFDPTEHPLTARSSAAPSARDLLMTSHLPRACHPPYVMYEAFDRTYTVMSSVARHRNGFIERDTSDLFTMPTAAVTLGPTGRPYWRSHRRAGRARARGRAGPRRCASGRNPDRGTAPPDPARRAAAAVLER